MAANQVPRVIGGIRTRHWAFGVGLPLQAIGLATFHTLCGMNFFDNPITYTSILTAAVGIIDAIRNSGKN